MMFLFQPAIFLQSVLLAVISFMLGRKWKSNELSAKYHLTYCLIGLLLKETIKGGFTVLIIKILAWARERTTPTERSPLVGEVSANVYG
jgi:hypothetical protein